MAPQTALVTGATSGIGKALACALAEKGFDLLLLAKTQAKLDAVAKQLRQQYAVSCQTICLNIENQPEVEKFLQEGHAVDLVINCAGVGEYAEILETADEKEESFFQINVGSAIKITKHYTKQFLIKGKGTALTVCSTAALFPHPFLSHYAASKSFLFQYTIGLSEEVRQLTNNVHVLIACPGPTRTPFFAKEVREQMNGNIWSKWFEMEPEQVANQIIKQIERKRRVKIIGKRNWWLVRLIQCLPYSLQIKVIGRYLKKGLVL